MKKFCITLIIIFIISLTVAVGVNSKTTNAEYLRIHIRANSNDVVDQNVKYEVKNLIVGYLTPYVANCNSKSEAENMLSQKKGELEKIVDGLLKKRGYDYTSNIVVRNEKFPTRVYEDFTLEEGFYDAVIVELGKAEGDNWWCVVYPPLCFTGNESGIAYKSKILEIINRFKSKNST